MSRFIYVENGMPIGVPTDRPVTITLPEREGKATNPVTGEEYAITLREAEVGCAHWDDATLKDYGWYRIEGQASETETETGYLLDGDVARPVIIDRPADELAAILASRKETALALVDQQAETTRQHYITAGEGQALAYSRKVAEATAYRTDPDGSYPYLNAELGLTGDTLAEVAAAILSKDVAWTTISAAIEGKRLHAKAAIRAAVTVAAVAAVVAGVEW